MPQVLNVLLVQINPTLGAIAANAKKIMDIIHAEQDKHDILVFPEHVLSGYPLEDLLFRYEIFSQIEEYLLHIQNSVKNCYVIVGHPSIYNNKRYNSASIFINGRLITRYRKQILPNYGIFDEKRYFTPGPSETCVFTVKDYKVGLCICEDLWQKGPVDRLIKEAGAKIIICINASPFDYEKYKMREDLLRQYATQGASIVYVNLIGGQDELVFDGQSLAMDDAGTIRARAKAFTEHLLTVQINNNKIAGVITPLPTQEESIYQALLSGVRDYINKNNLPGVCLGLSGGIDSALTLAIAVDALGSSRVHAVLMPSRYTAKISIDDANKQLQALQVEHTNLSIEPAFKNLLKTLAPSFADLPPDITEENIQARIRCLLLMAISNKTGRLALVTSNKSETAVGYTTLYGDMAGGFAVLKDVLKTQVYALARYRNNLSPVIPERVLTRLPSAELAPKQVDQDTLPPYDILDPIITLYMEYNLNAEEIIKRGYPTDLVHDTLRRITYNEYKRRQAAIGIKISPCAFGRDWRYPVTSGFLASHDTIAK